MQTVESLLKFANDLVCVDDQATIETIQTNMIGKEVSHIPIINHDQHENKGLVRRKSIWLWMLHNNGATPRLKDVIEKKLPEVNVCDSLASAMATLSGASGVLVRDEEKRYTHLLSPRVVANALMEYSEKFQLIEQLEDVIRDILKRVSNEELLAVLRGDTADLDKLTFGDYHDAISHLWAKLGMGHLDRVAVLHLLDDTRKYRNTVMHFRLNDDTNKGAAIELKRLLSIQLDR